MTGGSRFEPLCGAALPGIRVAPKETRVRCNSARCIVSVLTDRNHSRPVFYKNLGTALPSSAIVCFAL